MRMDLAGVGESHYWPEQSSQVLYSDKQLDDVSAAIDWLMAEAGVENILLYGRCSGAYLALQAAAREKRVAGVFVVNTRRFVWDPDEDVDTAIREPLQSLETYRRKMFDMKSVYKFAQGQIKPAVAAVKVARALGKTLDKKLAPVLGSYSKHHRMATRLYQLLRGINAQGLPVELVYSVNDPGMPELMKWFGSDLAGLKKYPNVQFRSIANADHNLTPFQARADVENLLLQFASNWKN
jgi:pimeloyl-ACP methyl ester carboxylesterase